MNTKNSLSHSKKSTVIRQKCLQQNSKFRLWAKRKSQQTFHSSHYDWWAFPIDSPSGSYGTAYQVQPNDLQTLFRNKQFVSAVEQNAILVCQSWGWDLTKGNYIKNATPKQKWQRWPIRLSKMCRSLQLFNNKQLFQNCITYGLLLLKQFKKFTYGGKDLTPYFYEKQKQLKCKNQKHEKHQMSQQKKQQPKQEKKIEKVQQNQIRQKFQRE